MCLAPTPTEGMHEGMEGGREGVVWLGLRGLTAPKAAVLGPLPKPCLVAPLQGEPPWDHSCHSAVPKGAAPGSSLCPWMCTMESHP